VLYPELGTESCEELKPTEEDGELDGTDDDRKKLEKVDDDKPELD